MFKRFIFLVCLACSNVSFAAVSSTSLLTEGFDDASLSARGWLDGGANNATIVTDATRGNVLEYSYAKGAITPSSGPMRHAFTETDDLTVTYWIKYQTGWIWSGHEFYLLTNKDDFYIGPSSTHLTGYIEVNPSGIPWVMFQDALNIDQTKIGASLKGTTENRGVMGCNGTSDSYPTGDCYNNGSGFYINDKSWKTSVPSISLNTWHSVKVHIKLNTIANNIGQADGIIQYWYDNVLVLDVGNAMMRTGANPTIKFNEIMIGPYIGAGTSQTQKFWIDGLSITGSNSGSIAAPTNLKIIN